MPLIERNIDLGRRSGLQMLLPWNLSLHGHAETRMGRPLEGLRTLDEALAGCAAVRLQYARVCTLLYRGRACLAAGVGEPAVIAAEALALAEARCYRALQADARRLLAEIALSRGERDAAAAHLAAAREIAEELDLDPDFAEVQRLAAVLAS
jgi:hypothetical protein